MNCQQICKISRKKT